MSDWPTPTSVGSSGPGNLELVYKYTVAGADKATIDTGVDTADAGSNDWTNGDVLEVFVYGRTDEAVVASDCIVRLNNDSGTNYVQELVVGTNTTLSGAAAVAQTSWAIVLAGASAAASFFGMYDISLPNYMGTTGYKTARLKGGVNDDTAGNNREREYLSTFRSTSAVSRLSLATVTAAKKFKIGSQILIYKRVTVATIDGGNA